MDIAIDFYRGLLGRLPDDAVCQGGPTAVWAYLGKRGHSDEVVRRGPDIFDVESAAGEADRHLVRSWRRRRIEPVGDAQRMRSKRAHDGEGRRDELQGAGGAGRTANPC